MPLSTRPVTLLDAVLVSQMIGSLFNELRGVLPPEARALDVRMVEGVLATSP